MRNKKISVSIIESNCFLREGLKNILSHKQYNVLADFSAIDSFLEKIKNDNNNEIYDIIIYGIDKNCSAGETESLLQKIKACQPGAHVVLWSSTLNKEIMSIAFSNKADGFVLKDISAEALICSLNLVVMGEKVFPTSMADFFSEAPSIWDKPQKNNVIPPIPLSNRELDILKCLAKGEPNKTIAHHLSIRDSTVKVHLKAILRKLGLHNRTQAALWAVQNNLANENEEFYYHNKLKPKC